MRFFEKADIKNLAVLLLLCLIISLPYFLYNPKQALLATLLLMLIALFSRIAFTFIAVYSLLINAFFLHIIPNWGASSLDSRIQAGLVAASYEKKEYLKAYFGLGDAFLMLLYVIATLLATYFIVKKLKLSSLAKRTFISVGIALFTLIFIFFPVKDTLRNLQLADLPMSIYSNYQSLQVVSKRKGYLDGLKKMSITCKNNFDKIVFIQGESVNKKHLGIYGYKRETTPFLTAISPYKFDAISPTNQTRYSIPIELTDAKVNDFDQFYESKSLVSTLSECGYTTYWISNQGESSETDTVITSIGSEADFAYFLNKLDYSTAGYDEKLISKIDSVGITSPKKQAFFIHLLGSHFVYSDRYPLAQEKWKTGNIVDQYDNSILYSDFVISEISKRFQKGNTLFIYLSDHGEVVGNIEHGHGYSEAVKDEYEVPLLIWSTEPYDKLADLSNTMQGQIINTESLNNIVEYLIGANDKIDASYSTKVISIQPDNIVDFSEMKYHKSLEN